ncbi:hypothetical protein SynA1562_01774 [Synechococcus sp. A15-62]|nr:hypothetical protein SynA1562_01774 [Synechococcus sp. A15-62]
MFFFGTNFALSVHPSSSIVAFNIYNSFVLYLFLEDIKP